MENGERSTYFLGATLIDPYVEERVQRYSTDVTTSLGMDNVIVRELHITLLPPFELAYEVATRLNLACACATLIRNHPLVSASFIIRGLSIMLWENKIILHFPVKLHNRTYPKDTFVDYVEALRKNVEKLEGFSWKNNIPYSFFPHITVLDIELSKGERKEGRQVSHIQGFIDRGCSEHSLSFHVGYPTLYAKHRTDRWYPLSQDPNLVKK